MRKGANEFHKGERESMINPEQKERRGPEEQKQEQEQERADVGGQQIVKAVEVD